MRAIGIRKRYILLLTEILTFVFMMSSLTYAAEVYTNGYFRYTVDDYSVTIISYTGAESEVTIPNMIAGNPVNVIGNGAFAKNSAVTVINLPDTIMNVEDGAFGEGQKVVYNFANNAPEDAGDRKEEDRKNNEDAGVEEKKDTAKEDKKEDKKEVEKETKEEDKKEGQKEDKEKNKGSLITVDNEDNLILVDAEGKERVLDDSKDYTIATDSDGKDIIKDSSGNVVNVTDSGVVEYYDKNNNKVSIDTKTGRKVVESLDGSYGSEEAEITGDNKDTGPLELADERISDKKESVEDNTSKDGDINEGKTNQEGEAETDKTERNTAKAEDFPLVTVVVMVIALATVVYIVLFRRKKG